MFCGHYTTKYPHCGFITIICYCTHFICFVNNLLYLTFHLICLPSTVVVKLSKGKATQKHIPSIQACASSTLKQIILLIYILFVSKRLVDCCNSNKTETLSRNLLKL